MYFLKEAATFVFNRHTTAQLQQQCVVLPSRRAVFYFKRELAELTDQPFLSPDVVAIDDFVMRESGVQQIDSLALLLELYDVFKTLDPNIEFGRFVGWGSMLLRDFDTVDQYLIDNPTAVFDYVRDAKALEKWGNEMADINRTFEVTPTVQSYFKLFDTISEAYTLLQERLTQKGVAYRGMAYRRLALEVQDRLVNHPTINHFYFVGLNALSQSEEQFIRKLVKAQKATTLWDSDSYYMQPNQKAGEVLRRYKRHGQFGDWNWEFDDLLTSEKEVRVMGFATQNLQAKVAGQLYSEALSKFPNAETAMVLADEQLLSPLLYSLDESVKDYNITMGISLKNSLLATLIEAIFDLQNTVVEFQTKEGEIKKVPKFSHRHIHKVLNHPFVRRYEAFTYPEAGANNPIRRTLRHIITNNLVYLSQQQMLQLADEDPLIQLIFKLWGNNVAAAFHCFHGLVDKLRIIYQQSPDAIEVEYLYLFVTLLHRLEGVMRNYNTLTVRNLRYFLNDLIRQEKIPFSGEPVANLQLITLLETRCLDFDHVIFLSLNDGKLPTSTKINSLIPFDACREFNLPVYHQQEGIMSYHFYRLLQRAKRIDLLYVKAEGKGLGGGSEPSRFVHQVVHELGQQNEKIKIEHLEVALGKADAAVHSQGIQVYKSAGVVATLKQQLAAKGLYPSHLSAFLACSLRFYFSRIAKLAEREEVDENLRADIFGNWLHRTLEVIDQDYTAGGRAITKEDIQQILQEIPQRLLQVHADDMPGIVIDQGPNALIKEIAANVLKQFFEEQLHTQTFPMEVLDVEKLLIVTVPLVIEGEVFPLQVAGRVDRIERVGNQLSVVDYKTGYVDLKQLLVKTDETLAESLLDPERDKLRQLWFYQYLVLKKIHEKKDFYLKNVKIEQHEVEAKIYSFRNTKEKLAVKLSFTPNETPLDFIRESEQLFQQIVGQLLDEKTPFSQSADPKVCKFCDYAGICGR